MSICTVSSVACRASKVDQASVSHMFCCLQGAAAQPEKKRRRGGHFTQSQLDALEDLYQSVSKPNMERRGALAQQLGLTDKQVLAPLHHSHSLIVKPEQHPQHAVESSRQCPACLEIGKHDGLGEQGSS